jgi:hypothetical protein
MNTFFKNGRRLKIKVLALTIILLISQDGKAQFRSSNFVPYSSVSFGIGTSSYYGDMAPYGRPFASTFGMMRWNVTADYTRHFNPWFGARASFTWARISGDDFKMNANGKGDNMLFARNLHFRNDLKEFAITGIIKLRPDSRSYDRRPVFSPYIFAGIGAIAHNPMARVPDLEGNQWVRLQPLGTEGQGSPGYAKPYPLVQLAIPLGFGFRYKINSHFDVAAELGFRFTNSDYLDDVAGNFPDPNVLKDDLARSMSNRSAEPTAARKGGDRTDGLRKSIAAIYKINDPSVDPFVVIQQTDFAAQGNPRGNSPGYNDSYMLGTIRITYILGTPIKCPPLK